jgi:hypothetical protein
MTDSQPVQIAFGRPWRAPTVQMGDRLITEATRVSVDCPTGEAPKIVLEFDGQDIDSLNLEGVVYVVREQPADPLSSVVEFLNNIDPDALTETILADDSLAGKPFGEAALDIMKRWASGD